MYKKIEPHYFVPLPLTPSKNEVIRLSELRDLLATEVVLFWGNEVKMRLSTETHHFFAAALLSLRRITSPSYLMPLPK